MVSCVVVTRKTSVRTMEPSVPARHPGYCQARALPQGQLPNADSTPDGRSPHLRPLELRISYANSRSAKASRSWIRVVMPSLGKMRYKWDLTVRGEPAGQVSPRRREIPGDRFWPAPGKPAPRWPDHYPAPATEPGQGTSTAIGVRSVPRETRAGARRWQSRREAAVAELCREGDPNAALERAAPRARARRTRGSAHLPGRA